MKKNQIEVQRLNQTASIPDDQQFKLWVDTALKGVPELRELVIRVVGEQESAELNFNYRDKKGATNVLSFPADVPDFFDIPLLGDLVICAPLMEKQAEQQNKPVEDHWAHIVIHGVLHLLGYDHENECEAKKMETKEIELLSSLGIDDPYRGGN